MKSLLALLTVLVCYGCGEASIAPPPAHVSMPQPAMERPAMKRPTMKRPAAVTKPARPVLDLGPKYRRCNQYDPLFLAAAQRWSPWGMKMEGARWLKIQAFKESSCRPTVCSGAGACGLLQHLEGTARDMGVTDRTDPVQSIEGGARYMAWFYNQWRAHGRTWLQRMRVSLDSYNRGIGNTLGAQRKWGCILWTCFRLYAPDETRGYVDFISAEAGHPVE